MGSLCLLQWILPPQESNQGLLHCRRIPLKLKAKCSTLKILVTSFSKCEVYKNNCFLLSLKSDNSKFSAPFTFSFLICLLDYIDSLDNKKCSRLNIMYKNTDTSCSWFLFFPYLTTTYLNWWTELIYGT